MNERIAELDAPRADDGTGFRPTGRGVIRIDGRAKVTGQARYAAEWPAPDLAFGVVVNSTIARGRILGFDLAAARAVPGVLEIVTHENRPRMRGLSLFYKDMTAPGGAPFRPLYDDKVLYSGQPVALVVAETFEAARHAAHLVEVRYEAQPHETDLMANLGRARAPKPMKAGFSAPPKDKGEPDAAFEAAAHQIQGDYYSGVEHHNPMELFASTVIRGDDGHFTIYDKTQGSQNSRWYVSHVFGLSKNKVTVRNPYVGGAFGSGLRPQYQLPLAVMASILLDRSVRVVMTRQQMFTFGHRPETVQRVKLGADRDGRLRSVWHEAIAETSRIEDYVEVVVNWSGQLYACDNVHLGYHVVDLDQYTPIDMRAPGAPTAYTPWKWRWTNWPTTSASTRWNCACATTPRSIPQTTSRIRPRRCASAMRRVPSASAGRGARCSRARAGKAANGWAGAWPQGNGTRCRCSRAPTRCCTPTGG